jgi:hypothetical protein
MTKYQVLYGKRVKSFGSMMCKAVNKDPTTTNHAASIAAMATVLGNAMTVYKETAAVCGAEDPTNFCLDVISELRKGFLDG